ncbi:MAG: ABC transporter ATP-binding protein [Candidatus Binatia bacterium]
MPNPAEPDVAALLLAVRGVSKRFGNTQALADVTLDFRAGEIHAVLGENGAGKSTLMHILAGILRPDAGRLFLAGWPASFASPRQARNAGIGMVHQHFTLVEALTVAENLALSLPRQSCWRYDRAAAATEAAALAQRIGLDLSPLDVPVSQLAVGARQRLEILKALAHAERVLILDEPTAVLTPQEVRTLFVLLRQLRGQGRLIVFITHKLREVQEVADRVTIMRRGRHVGTFATAELSEREMAERMIGDVAPMRLRAAACTAGESVLQASQLAADDESGAPALVDVSFSVRAGEIFGIAGVDGNGQQELFEVLVGLRRPSGGTLRVRGRAVTTFTPRAALAAGLGHIPPDRQHQGLVLPMTLQENMLLSRVLLDRCSRWGMVDVDAARRVTAEAARQYGIRADLQEPVRSLSGGNQQRVVVARALAEDPAVLIAANPSRGLDVAATRAVADALLDSARRGCAVVLISTDLDEVLDLSHRVSVLSRGRLSPALEPPIDTDRLGLLMAGVPH